MGHSPCPSKILNATFPRRLALSAMLLSLGSLQAKTSLLGRWTILLTFRTVGQVGARAFYEVVHAICM